MTSKDEKVIVRWKYRLNGRLTIVAVHVRVTVVFEIQRILVFDETISHHLSKKRTAKRMRKASFPLLELPIRNAVLPNREEHIYRGIWMRKFANYVISCYHLDQKGSSENEMDCPRLWSQLRSSRTIINNNKLVKVPRGPSVNLTTLVSFERCCANLTWQKQPKCIKSEISVGKYDVNVQAVSSKNKKIKEEPSKAM